MSEMKRVADGEVERHEVAFEVGASLLECFFADGTEGEDVVGLGELGEARVWGRVGEEEGYSCKEFEARWGGEGEGEDGGWLGFC